MRGEQSEGTLRFAAVVPLDGQQVHPDSLLFQWRSQGAGVSYRLTLTNGIGDVVWTASTSDTSVALPGGVGLAPGREYFWYVDALLGGARSSTTGVLEFVVTP
jgi:hypothetical protein